MSGNVTQQPETLPSDASLVESFIASRDPAAFESLLHRHGPMVYGVCLRTLGHHQDAEEAFQAVFLILSLKAASIHPHGRVGNWLYGVAFKTALKSRALRTKRTRRVQVMPDIPESPAKNSNSTWEDLAPHLDQELHLLPEKYRATIVLCDLEGKSQSEAADQLGLNVGALSMQLTRGRRLLADRLTRKGITFASVTTLALLLQTSAPAAVPATLAATTLQLAGIATFLPTTLAASATATSASASLTTSASTQFVTTLAQGVIKSMAIPSAAKIGTPVALALLVGLGGIAILKSDLLVPPPEPPEPPPAISRTFPTIPPAVDILSAPVAPPITPVVQTSEQILADLQGKWKLIAVERSGSPLPEAHWKGMGDLLEITDDKFHMDSTVQPETVGYAQGKINIDTSVTPARMTWYDMKDLMNAKSPNAPSLIGIVKIENGTLQFCYVPLNPDPASKGVTPPTEFKTHPDRLEMLMSLERE